MARPTRQTARDLLTLVLGVAGLVIVAFLVAGCSTSNLSMDDRMNQRIDACVAAGGAPVIEKLGSKTIKYSGCVQ